MSAADIAKLSRAIIREFPEYYRWYSQREFTWNNIRQQNRNGLLERDPSVDGMKTGMTDAAGYCLVSSAKRDGMRLIAVVTGTKSMKAREDASLALLNYGFNFFETRVLKKAGTELAVHRVYRASGGEAAVGLASDLAVTLPRGQADKVEYAMELAPKVFAPLTKADRIGTLRATDRRQGHRRGAAAAARGRAASATSSAGSGTRSCPGSPEAAHAAAARLARRPPDAARRGAHLAARPRFPVRGRRLRGAAGLRRPRLPLRRAHAASRPQPRRDPHAPAAGPRRLARPPSARSCTATAAATSSSTCRSRAASSRSATTCRSRARARRSSPACRNCPRCRPTAIEKGVAGITAEDIRWSRCDIKSTSLLGNVLLRWLAADAGATETLLLRGGILTEGSASSAHVVQGRPHRRRRRRRMRSFPARRAASSSSWPRARASRRSVARCREAELRAADEILIASAGGGIRAVTALDGRPVGAGAPGPVYRRIYAAFKATQREFSTGLPA